MNSLTDWKELNSIEYQKDFYIKKFVRYLEGTETEVVQINVSKCNTLNSCRVYFFPNIYRYMDKPKSLKSFESSESIDIVKLKVSIMLAQCFKLNSL